MNAVRQIVDSSALENVINLPGSFKKNKKVEIIVFPVQETQSQEKPEVRLTRSQLRESLKGSITEELAGVLSSASHMTLDEIRAERLAKHDRID
jgi:hypothetical protein